MEQQQLYEAFDRLYPHAQDVQHTFCPYRVCPLGAHVDHQFGKITGFAIEKGIHIAYTATDNGVVEVSSLNFEGKKQFHVRNVPAPQHDWADYLRGATWALGRKCYLERGIYAVIQGTLPIGGLSSSAAAIIAFLAALCRANDIVLSKRELIRLALEAENGYVGVSVGKLDQSCEIYSKKDHLLYLDTRDDSYELIPQNPNMPPYEIAVLFSGVQRTLVGSAFNMRVDEVRAAAYALMGYANMPYGKFADVHLRDVPKDVFEQFKDRLPDNWRKRAEHFYTEQDRVQRGAQYWREGDIESFGRCVFESGKSSIYNFETGSPELKAIYEALCKCKGVYGGRFSGAGFKGCCIALIEPSSREQIAAQVTREYLNRFPQYEGLFEVFFTRSADGCVV